ncbi:MAG: hypothetical protein KDA44_19700, partial [Planctomycetales bacterium]|nr:hypothetical protein [Planctomycetales bacterium]
MPPISPLPTGRLGACTQEFATGRAAYDEPLFRRRPPRERPRPRPPLSPRPGLALREERLAS